MERQDANSIAYKADVTARMLLSGSVDPPEWAQTLIQTLEDCTGAPTGRRWMQELQSQNTGNYMFGGSGSGDSGYGTAPSTLKKNQRPGYFRRTSSSSMFDFRDHSQDNLSEDPYVRTNVSATPNGRKKSTTTPYFETQFESDFVPDSELRKHKKITPNANARRDSFDDDFEEGSPFNDVTAPSSSIGTSRSRAAPSSSWLSRDVSHRRSVSAYTPPKPTPKPRQQPLSKTDYTSVIRARVNSMSSSNDGQDYLEDLDGRPPPPTEVPKKPMWQPKEELTKPLKPSEGVARAIALFDFKGVQVRHSPCL